MNFSEYQKAAYSTCTPECFSDDYLYWGLISEVGELAGKIAKRIRGDNITDEAIIGELGDIAWFIAVKALHEEMPFRYVRPHILYKDNPIEALLYLIIHKHSPGRMITVLEEICKGWGFTLCQVMEANIKKLASRQKRGVIQGEGDNR